MTRDKLLGLADKYALFANERDDYPVSMKLDRMREQIFVDLIRAGSNNSRNATAIAFTLGFENESPEIARAVANDLVTLFLEENVKSRTERATETTDFLENEADKLKRQLNSIETAIAEYKSENKDALPEHLEIYMDSMERAELAARQADRDMTSIRQQLDIYKVELSRLEEQRKYMGIGAASASLIDLKTEYAKLRSQYNDNHPRIRLLAEEIRYLEESMEDTPLSGSEIELRSQMAAAEARIASLESQKLEYQARAAELQERIIRVPLVERGLKSLSRDYENAKNQYDQIFSKGMEAGIAESLEEGRKAERFSVIEPPLLPDTPVKPNRAQLLLAGIFLSFAVPIGVIVLLEMADKSIRGVQRVIQITEQPPLVVIPLITTPAEELVARRHFLLVVSAMVAAVITGLLAFHFMYMPLDLLSQKAMHRWGLG
jgi:polysaccharide chain length determinant protein (PEP-CTERM system associated)